MIRDSCQLQVNPDIIYSIHILKIRFHTASPQCRVFSLGRQAGAIAFSCIP